MTPTQKYCITGLIGLAATGTLVANTWAQRSHGPRLPIDLAQMSQRMDARFAAADADTDGLISPAEFDNMQAPGGHKGHRFGGRRSHHFADHPRGDAGNSDDRVSRRANFEAELFAAMDTDGNGELSAAEASHDNRRAHMKKLRKQKRFAHLDADNDGYLNRSEFDVHLTRMQELDTNDDGLVSREELRKARGTHPRMHSPAKTG